MDASSYTPLVRAALDEDIGTGDLTSAACVPADTHATATIVQKAPGVISGHALAACAFSLVDPHLSYIPLLEEGVHREYGDIARIEGPARSLLSGERVALNFLQRMSGVATLTHSFVEAIRGTNAQILDTRKTTPLFRELERAAVRHGGGCNHRFGLFDAVLIKENHVLLAGGIKAAIIRAREQTPDEVWVEVECTSVAEVTEALGAGAERFLLDNMSTDQLRECARLVGGGARLEASGNVSLETVRAIAETGVDFISVGALTHSAPALDLSLLVTFSDTSLPGS
jgi:nicotinate-nucleotide pyrophosphorylase (carboxylating)